LDADVEKLQMKCRFSNKLDVQFSNELFNACPIGHIRVND
jgi:hypothetical protein